MTKKITIERTLDARVEELWDRWTTKGGIESWWGPDGFEVEVRELDLRAGGELQYAMIATAPPQMEFMKKAGMPLTTEVRLEYTEVIPHQRLAYQQLADFIPGVKPYAIATTVELHPVPKGVKIRVTFDAMHDEVWTQRSVMGRENELGKLAKVVESARQ